MWTSNGSGFQSGSTGTRVPSRSSWVQMIWGGHGADAESLQNVLLAHLKVVGARPHLGRQLVSALLLGHAELSRAAEAEVDERQGVQLCGVGDRFG